MSVVSRDDSLFIIGHFGVEKLLCPYLRPLLRFLDFFFYRFDWSDVIMLEFVACSSIIRSIVQTKIICSF